MKKNVIYQGILKRIKYIFEIKFFFPKLIYSAYYFHYMYREKQTNYAANIFQQYFIKRK